MKIEKRSEALTVIFYTLIQSMVVGFFMAYVAVKNNSQEQMINLDSGDINYLELATVFGSWLIGSAVFSLAIFAVVFFIKHIVKRLQSPQ